MTTLQRILCNGGAFLLAAALVDCNGSPATTPDLGATADLAPAPGAPTLTAVTPSNAINTGGTPIVLTGTNFQAGATVTIAGVPATNVVVVSSTQITCVVPAKAANCGARAVQVGTSMFTDPTLMVRIVDELREKLQSAGTTVAELRGALHRDAASAAAPAAACGTTAPPPQHGGCAR